MADESMAAAQTALAPDPPSRRLAPLWVDVVTVAMASAWAFALLLTSWPRLALEIMWVEHLVAPQLIHAPTPLLTWGSALQGSAEATAGLATACTTVCAIARLAARWHRA